PPGEARRVPGAASIAPPSGGVHALSRMGARGPIEVVGVAAAAVATLHAVGMEAVAEGLLAGQVGLEFLRARIDGHDPPRAGPPRAAGRTGSTGGGRPATRPARFVTHAWCIMALTKCSTWTLASL